MRNDWRYDLGKNMEGKSFVRKAYKPLTIDNDHDHCEFCTSKFSLVIEDALKVGYQTITPMKVSEKRFVTDSWVCETCFHDFKEILNLQIIDVDEEGIL